MFRTPIIADLRTNGSTFYTFSSAMEDIGLNINERNNKVYLSNYVLLKLPDMYENQTGCISIDSFFSDQTDPMRGNLLAHGEKWFSVLLNNYMMNLETLLRNQGSYDHSAASTVTERCFWKFLQKSGALSLQKDGDYYHESWSNENDIKNCVIKGFGTVTSSSQSSNSYNINNETYIMIPSSYGQMKYLLEAKSDNNMTRGQVYTPADTTALEGHSGENGMFIEPLADTASKSYTTSSEKDCLEMVFDLTKLREKLTPLEETLTFDELAMNHYIRDKYDFNAILVYYTIYDSVGNGVATNLFGILVTKGAEADPSNAGHYTFPAVTKLKSSAGEFGSSYAFRLNMQTASIYDSTNDTIIDYSSAESSTITDFNEVVSNLKNTVDILKNNAAVLTNVYNNNQTMRYLVNDAIERVTEVEKKVNDFLHGNVRDISANSVDTDILMARKVASDVEFVDDYDTTVAKVISSGINVYGTLSSNIVTVSNKLNTKDLEATGTAVVSSLSVTDQSTTNMKLNGTIGDSTYTINGNVSSTLQGGSCSSETVTKNGTTVEILGRESNVYGKTPADVFDGATIVSTTMTPIVINKILKSISDHTYTGVLDGDQKTVYASLEDSVRMNNDIKTLAGAGFPSSRGLEGTAISGISIPTNELLLLLIKHLANKGTIV